MTQYWRQVRGKRDGVPVNWFWFNRSSCKFANWPNSAGMGPEVYKTQSKHTKIESRYRTGTIWLRNASLCLNIEGKSGWVHTSSTLTFETAVTQVKSGDVPNTLKWVPRHRFLGFHNELPRWTVLCMWRKVEIGMKMSDPKWSITWAMMGAMSLIGIQPSSSKYLVQHQTWYHVDSPWKTDSTLKMKLTWQIKGDIFRRARWYRWR